jgi:hypothetical protein
VREVIGEQTPVANDAPPAISGGDVVGQTLNAIPGQWAGSPYPSLAYQWCTTADTGVQGNCPTGYSTIGDPTGQTYTVRQEDAGHALTVVVSAVNALGSASASAAPTSIVDSSP